MMGRRRRKKVKQFGFRVNQKFIWIISFSLLAIAVFWALSYAVYRSSAFKIKEEDIKSNIVLSRSIKEKIKGKFLFSLDIKPIALRLSREHPQYKKIYILRKFPSAVIIEAQRRMPFAQIKGKKFYPIDREAVILDDGAAYPLAGFISVEISEYNRLFKKGYHIKDKRLMSALELIEALELLNFTNELRVKLINSTKMESIYFIIDSAGSKSFDRDIKVIIGKGNFPQRIRLLGNLMHQELKNKLPLVEYIDLRYKKVYVGFRR